MTLDKFVSTPTSTYNKDVFNGDANLLGTEINSDLLNIDIHSSRTGFFGNINNNNDDNKDDSNNNNDSNNNCCCSSDNSNSDGISSSDSSNDSINNGSNIIERIPNIILPIFKNTQTTPALSVASSAMSSPPLSPFFPPPSSQPSPLPAQ